jgi:hypothetical protein
MAWLQLTTCVKENRMIYHVSLTSEIATKK